MITIRSQIHSLGDTATAVQYVYLQQEFGDQLISTPQTSPNKPKQTRGLLSYGGAFNVCRLMQCAVRCVPCSYPFLPRSFSPTALRPPLSLRSINVTISQRIPHAAPSPATSQDANVAISTDGAQIIGAHTTHSQPTAPR